LSESFPSTSPINFTRREKYRCAIKEDKMCFPTSHYLRLSLRALFVAGLALLGVATVYAQDSDSSDVAALKAQIQKMQQESEARTDKMQKQYEDRISALEGEVQSLKSKAESGSILNTHVLTDSDGKQYEGKGPALDESFLKSLTRNFTFSAYVRVGVQFNGSGGGGNFNFEPPDNEGGRPRLGNENDTYMELTWMQAHMLGDNPDVMDVSMRFTPSISYLQSRNTFTVAPSTGVEETGNDFRFVMREAFLEMSNVFRSAPEITFWAGQRFYDRQQIEPMDYYWLDMSGYGAGVKNIDLGIGKLWVAYLGGLDDSLFSTATGTFYKHSLDVRLKDVSVGPGKFMLFGIANYEKGTTFTQGYDGEGNVIKLTHPLHTSDAWGLGGGAGYAIDLSAIGAKSLLEFYALFGFGSTNFSAGTDTGIIIGLEGAFLAKNPLTPAGVRIDAGNAIQKQRAYRAGWFFVWNPNPCFTVANWGFWQQDSAGYRRFGNQGPGTSFREAPGTRNLFEAGIRPYYWIADNIAIGGQAFGSYQDNVRGFEGTTAFGRSGSMGVFTIAPVIKPKGGYFTRPELRFFATYAIWSDSLRGAATSVGEGGNIGGLSPTPYAKSNDGWLLGTQVEWFF
jgi:maltoporin